MTAYKCVAWVLDLNGVRRPEATDTIQEAELSPIFVIGSRMLSKSVPGAGDVPGWLAACEFARRIGVEDAFWKLPPATQADARVTSQLAKALPVIIRVEEAP